MTASSSDPFSPATSAPGKKAGKTGKDIRLRVIITIGAVLLAIVCIPFVSSISYTMKFRNFQNHLSQAISDGNSARTILIRTKDSTWIPEKDTISTFNILIGSTSLGRVIDSSDIPEDAEVMQFEFGNGKYMNVYNVQIDDKTRRNHKGVIIEYWEENYGPYIYENSVLTYDNFESLLEKSPHSKKFN